MNHSNQDHNQVDPPPPPVRYKECLKNHAASLGGHATDGCREFIHHHPSDALTCSACGCHRNFHRKEEAPSCESSLRHSPLEDGDPFLGGSVQRRKKRFRTKFSQYQKERLIAFADNVGWKMHKLDQSVVREFCEEIGIKRKVLKVWMHNNKHHYVHKDPHFYGQS